MNRIILVIMFFVSFNEVYAQKKMQSSSPHEFSVHGGFGLSALQYQIKEGDNKSGIGGSVGIGYSYMFSPQWGLNTGVEISFYNAQCDMNVLTGEHPVTGIEESFIFKTSYTDYNETQNASYLNIPVMILFKTQTSTVFYGSAGAKLGFPINSKYKSSGNVTTSAFFEHENQEYKNMPDRGFGSFNNIGGNAKLEMSMNLSCSVEGGMEWLLNKKWALRTGFYLDYGFWDIRNGNKNQQLIEYNNDNPSILIHNSLLYTNQANKVNTLAAGIKLCIIIKY